VAGHAGLDADAAAGVAALGAGGAGHGTALGAGAGGSSGSGNALGLTVGLDLAGETAHAADDGARVLDGLSLTGHGLEGVGSGSKSQGEDGEDLGSNHFEGWVGCL